jgi:hypothetical protein
MRLFLLLMMVGCAGPSQSVRKTDAVLIVECDVPSASVYVDEAFAGRAAELGRGGLKVPHGTLRVEVRADGYFPAYREVPVQAGERAHVKLPLRAVPGGET